ncbi:unnamed protein product [Phytophthora fragariaefolia]|uniref:Unnamed protein product n=1 Tax=Phytophthora fragariaefolia TaxID=1490495 RepID=A0A9W6TSY3_9STRA|nr:unnamed protein product [Phytophthora fragariaefolia]
MSSDEEEVKLYSKLEHNKKRQMFGASCRPLVVDSDEDDDDLYSPSEREAERLRKLKMEEEIRKKLKSDKVLNQTRAILKKVSSTKRQTTVNNMEVISLDSDSDDESNAGSPSEAEVAAPPLLQPVVDKGPRITLHIRSNGGAVDEIGIHKVSAGKRRADTGVCLIVAMVHTLAHVQKETFDQLYTSFCELHGLPRSAVKMSLDGEPLALTGSPAEEDLDSGDLIEAKVDFAKQDNSKKKTFLRLRLVVFGKRSETFKIDSRHGITNPDDVVMSVQDQKLRLNERLDFYGLIDLDEISVKVSNNFVDTSPRPQTIGIQLRYAEGDPQTHHIIPVR